MKHTSPIIILLLSVITILPGCKKKNSTTSDDMPKFTFTVQGQPARDSTVWLLLYGEKAQTFNKFISHSASDKFEINPDTTLYNRAIVYIDGGVRLQSYYLRNAQWGAAPIDSLKYKVNQINLDAGYEQRLATISGPDVYGKFFSLPSIYKEKTTALLFITPQASDSSAMAKLVDKVPTQPDTTNRVYLILTPTDAEAKNIAKSNKLRGTVISDSLGIVSRARDAYGVYKETQVIMIDSLGKVKR